MSDKIRMSDKIIVNSDLRCTSIKHPIGVFMNKLIYSPTNEFNTVFIFFVMMFDIFIRNNLLPPNIDEILSMFSTDKFASLAISDDIKNQLQNAINDYFKENI